MTEERKELLQQIAAEHGTPIFIIDQAQIRENYHEFKKELPDVQAYFAVKSNSDPEIIKTMFDLGASFDIASLPEFMMVYEHIKDLPLEERQKFVWDRIIYANTIKPGDDLAKMNDYKMWMTFDNSEELKKIKKYAPDSALILRIRVPNKGSMVELSSKFGAHPSEAIELLLEAKELGLHVYGISFHVGSQCNNFENYSQAFEFASSIFEEARLKDCEIGFIDADGKQKKVLDIGGGFPVKYTPDVKTFSDLAKKINSEIHHIFPDGSVKVIAEPGRFMVATACTSVTKIVGKSVRDGKTCYYLNDGVYHTFSAQIFDHQLYPLHAFKDGKKETCTTFGPTCDAFDTISLSDELPGDLQIDDLLFAENVGAYTLASATSFNGFPPAKVVHINK